MRRESLPFHHRNIRRLVGDPCRISRGLLPASVGGRSQGQALHVRKYCVGRRCWTVKTALSAAGFTFGRADAEGEIDVKVLGISTVAYALFYQRKRGQPRTVATAPRFRGSADLPLAASRAKCAIRPANDRRRVLPAALQRRRRSRIAGVPLRQGPLLADWFRA